MPLSRFPWPGIMRVCLVLSLPTTGGVAHAGKPAINLGQRWELLIDSFLVDITRDAVLALHEPRRAEVVLVTDAAWEGPTSAYFTVLKDGDTIRLYYRGSVGGSDHSDDQVTCVAESRDGVHFTRPNLGVIEVKGTKANNVVWKGVESIPSGPPQSAGAPDAWRIRCGLDVEP